MKKIFQHVATFVACLLISFGAFAQIQEVELDIPTGNLPSTNRSLLKTQGDILGSGESDAGNIYYGATPPNLRPNSPVIVFIHGYSSRASTWWDGNDMYTKAYNDGYRTAFVSVHPDKTMWVNGQLFRNMLNTITSKYGVQRVVVVAHSKGGLDTDAALVHYGGTAKVERVITLGSPHFGTPLADLAQSGWVSWLSGVFGQVNDATYSLQTGYAGYFRSQTDNHPNRPNARFRTVGAWGYGGILWIPGQYLNWNGGGRSKGGNDGVVTYPSTKRPNSMHLLGGYGTSATDLDHSEVHKGTYMWTHIKNNLPSTLSKEDVAPNFEPAFNPNAVVESRVQVVSADKGDRNFVVERGVSSTLVDIHHLSSSDNFTLIAPNGERVRATSLRKGEAKSFDMLGGYSTTLRIDNPMAGTYSIESEKPFVALVTGNEGVGIRLTSDLNHKKYYYEVGETINLNIDILNEMGVNTQGTSVTGVMQLTSDEENFTSAKSIVVDFKETNGRFTARINERLPEGVYNINIQAENGNFSKSLVTSIAVVDGVLHKLGNTDTKIEEHKIDSRIKLLPNYPNPFNASTTIAFELKEETAAVLTIYDAVGRMIERVDLSSYGIGTHEYTWNVNGKVKNGLYIAEIRNGNERVTQTMVYSK